MNALEFIERVGQHSVELEDLSKAFNPEDKAYQDLQESYKQLQSLASQTENPQLRAQIAALGEKLQQHTAMRRGARNVMGKERRQMGSKLGAEQTERRVANRRAETDALTGLANIEGYKKNQKANPKHIYVAIDLTHFKDVNEAFGHPGGDQALRNVAGVMKQALAAAGINPADANKFLHRTGGDEFVAMVKTPQQAARYARALRSGLEQLRFGHVNPAPGKEGDAAGDSIQASATIGIGRTHDEADVAAAVAKNRKNKRVGEHMASVPPEHQIAARQHLLRTGSINGESLIEAHSFLPGLEGPLDTAQDSDSRWSAPHARRPLPAASFKAAHIDPPKMPTPVESTMRPVAPATTPKP
jgi:diguanylate cyclase (GGDEF)-like protein